ncbi:hypothetical protein [Steroidobacter gossypii]|uniref:hypothetical protein n=1 Tax=Steroidobacter gossypii TaxID=2805490 RepID=UPI001C3FC803|nr:hypothetical protein [Steroidobacter gossypii]
MSDLSYWQFDDERLTSCSLVIAYVRRADDPPSCVASAAYHFMPTDVVRASLLFDWEDRFCSLESVEQTSPSCDSYRSIRIGRVITLEHRDVQIAGTMNER